MRSFLPTLLLGGGGEWRLIFEWIRYAVNQERIYLVMSFNAFIRLYLIFHVLLGKQWKALTSWIQSVPIHYYWEIDIAKMVFASRQKCKFPIMHLSTSRNWKEYIDSFRYWKFSFLAFITYIWWHLLLIRLLVLCPLIHKKGNYYL